MIEFTDTDRLEALARLLQRAADFDEHEQVRAGLSQRSVLLFAGQHRLRPGTRRDPAPPTFNGAYFCDVIPPRVVEKYSTYNSTAPLHDEEWDAEEARYHGNALDALRGALDNLIAREPLLRKQSTTKADAVPANAGGEGHGF